MSETNLMYNVDPAKSAPAFHLILSDGERREVASDILVGKTQKLGAFHWILRKKDFRGLVLVLENADDGIIIFLERSGGPACDGAYERLPIGASLRS